MKRIILLALLCIPNAACSSFDRTEIQACERKLTAGLKSPSSYDRVKTSVWDDDISFENLAGRYFGPDLEPQEKQLLDEIKGKKLTVRHASIEYDADNSYGAAIRDTFYCNFIAVDGKLYAPSAAYETKWEQQINSLIGKAEAVTVKNADYAPPQDPLAPDYDPFPGSGMELPPY
jgi:hypothetical protein